MCQSRSTADGEKYRALKLEAANVMKELAEDEVTAPPHSNSNYIVIVIIIII